MGNAPFLHVLSVAGIISVLSECQPPSEPEVREVQVALRAGGRKAELLDLEVDGWKKNSTIRPSLPQDLAQGGYSEFMQEMLASWHDFMSYTPDWDDRFEEDERKSRGKEITWKQRLKQLASIVQLGLRKHEIMDMYGGHDLYPAVAGTYWLHKTDFERLPLSKEVHLFQEIWKIVGRRLLPSIKKCQVKQPCACHFVACNRSAAGEGQLSALELRSTSFEWPKLNTILPTTAAPGVKYLALDGKDAFKHPEFWLQAFPAIKVLQLFVPNSHIENVAILLHGWREKLLGFSLHWNPELEILHQDPVEVPSVLWESICSLKNLRRLELDGCFGYITRLPECLGQLPLLELDVRGSQFRDDMAMPEGLKSLGKTLVSFIAYSQGLDRRCNQPPPRHWNHISLGSFSFISRCRPRPSWDGAEPIDALDDDEEEWAWQCPWESWVSRLDHYKAPWWSWHQIERFWVDANFLYGSFPATLAEAWPKMRSLDLQLNELSGPLPAEALSKLQNLTALRIHRNNFSGPVAAVIFEAPSLQYTNLEGNSGLSGCIPVRKADEENKHLLDVPIQGTKITGLCQGKRGKDGAEL